MSDDQEQRPDSLLPYDEWTETALRQVVVRALQYAAAHGLPGEHHFYVTFRTDHPGVVVPSRLRAQYPQEMTIVLQHQFWDLKVDEEAGLFSIGLSFGGIPSTLVVPLGAMTAFADPLVRIGWRFLVVPPVEEPQAAPEPEAVEPPAEREALPAGVDPTPQVVSLDAFRRKAPPRE